MEDSQIIALYWDRDQRAIEETARKYGGVCHRIAMNILSRHEDAEECVNDTYHAAWNQIPPEQPPRLLAYLGRIVRNISISRFRANQAQKRCQGMEILLSELENCLPAAETVDAAMERKLLGGIISRWLDSLEKTDRVLFVRRYWYGDSVQSLARETGCSPNQMAQRMLRLRRGLKAALEQEGAYL